MAASRGVYIYIYAISILGPVATSSLYVQPGEQVQRLVGQYQYTGLARVAELPSAAVDKGATDVRPAKKRHIIYIQRTPSSSKD